MGIFKKTYQGKHSKNASAATHKNGYQPLRAIQTEPPGNRETKFPDWLEEMMEKERGENE